MASCGYVRNDKTGEIQALVALGDVFEFVDSAGKRSENGLGCAGGWTLLEHAKVDETKMPLVVSAEIAKIATKDLYGAKAVIIGIEIAR